MPYIHACMDKKSLTVYQATQQACFVMVTIGRDDVLTKRLRSLDDILPFSVTAGLNRTLSIPEFCLRKVLMPETASSPVLWT